MMCAILYHVLWANVKMSKEDKVSAIKEAYSWMEEAYNII